MLRSLSLRAISLVVLCFYSGAGFAADIAKGEKLYRQCQGCHSIGPDAPNGFGPQLNGVFEREPGSLADYEYSLGFNKATQQGLRWNSSNMNEFLTAPMEFIVGTRMAFPGVQSPDDRNELIAYLKLVGIDGELPETPKVKASRALSNPRALAEDTVIPEHGIFHIGRQALAREVSAWDIDIRPDGAGLPEGSGSVLVGTDLYDNNCAACHGIFGEGLGRWPVLAGGHDTLQDDRPEKTIGSYWPYLSTVYDYVRRAMPFGNARSLSDDDVYAITAYLLYLNDLVDEDFVLSTDNFTSVRLPNEANFVADNRHEEMVDVAKGPCMSDCFAGPAVVTQRARILDVTPDTQPDDNDEEGAAVSLD